jgi:serine/threonine-protein kinase HipA
MHYDFNIAGGYAYEQALQAIRRLGLPMADIERQVRRAFFKIVARNQDDHVKNIAFLMDRKGSWRLSPAFDMAYSFNPSGVWTGQHQMSLNAKRDGFDLDDLLAFAGVGGLKRMKAKAILADVSAAVSGWRGFAQDAGLAGPDIDRIERTQRRELFV